MKVIVNYPDTEEGMKMLQKRLAEATLQILRKTLDPMELEQLMKELQKEVKDG